MSRTSPSGPFSSISSVVSTALTAVGAASTATVSVAVADAQVSDGVVVTPLAAIEAGLGVVGARVSVAGTVVIQLINPTAGAINWGVKDVRVDLLK